MKIRITSLKVLDKPESNLKAFAVIEYHGIEIKDIKVMDGRNGLFISWPSREYTDQQGEKKYSYTIWIPDEALRDEINNFILTEYHNELESLGKRAPSNQPPPSNQPAPTGRGNQPTYQQQKQQAPPSGRNARRNPARNARQQDETPRPTRQAPVTPPEDDSDIPF
jgi:DNA-binding cell septation regulator SpoVG